MLSGWKNNAEKYVPLSSIRTPEGDIIREQIDLAVNERLNFFEERIVELQRHLENESNSQKARPVLPDYVLKMCTGQSQDEEIKVVRDSLVKSLGRLRSEKARAAVKIRERIEQVVDLYLARTVVKEVITGTLDINAIPVGEIMTSDTIVAELIERYKRSTSTSMSS
jgi:predicted DNA-binding protein